MAKFTIKAVSIQTIRHVEIDGIAGYARTVTGTDDGGPWARGEWGRFEVECRSRSGETAALQKVVDEIDRLVREE